MEQQNKTNYKRVFIIVKGWDCYNEMIDDNKQTIREYLEWVKKNTGAERLHYTISGRGL